MRVFPSARSATRCSARAMRSRLRTRPMLAPASELSVENGRHQFDQPAAVLGRRGPAPQEALYGVTSCGEGCIELWLGLDAFRDDGCAQAVGQVDDADEQRCRRVGIRL